MAMHFTRRELFWDAHIAPHCAAGRTKVNLSRICRSVATCLWRDSIHIVHLAHGTVIPVALFDSFASLPLCCYAKAAVMRLVICKPYSDF